MLMEGKFGSGSTFTTTVAKHYEECLGKLGLPRRRGRKRQCCIVTVEATMLHCNCDELSGPVRDTLPYRAIPL